MRLRRKPRPEDAGRDAGTPPPESPASAPPVEATPRKPEKDGEKKPTPPRPSRERLYRLLGFAGALLLAGGLYVALRDFAYRRSLRDLAQAALSRSITAEVGRIGGVEIDWDGNLVLRDVEIFAERDGDRRLFYRARRAVLSLDGWPLRDDNLRVTRVDIYGAQVHVWRRQKDGWNLAWILRRPPAKVPVSPVPPPPPAADPAPPAPGLPSAPPPDAFPVDGVHLHDASILVSLEKRDGGEVGWMITKVEAQVTRPGGQTRIDVTHGDFYGGRFLADATVRSTQPLALDVTMSVAGADLERLARRMKLKRPVTGRIDGVVSLAADVSVSRRPVAAGRIEVSEGNLYELPAFTGLLGIFALDPVPDRRIEGAQLLFTAERDLVRIDKMNFLGSPVSLFGEGTMALTGEDLRVVLVPRLGKSWDAILPFVGAPIQALLDVAKGALVPVVVGGSFWAPTFQVAPDEPVSEPVRRMIDESRPRK